MPVLPTFLHPQMVMARISRLIVINTTLQDRFGTGAGGSNVRKTPSRSGSYDVFDDTREVATATVPGAPAVHIARQPVGNVPFRIPRSAEKLPIPKETVNQIRPVGGQVNEIDELGRQYIQDQEQIVRQRNTNLREFQTSAMLRGSYTFTQSGVDMFTHAYSGGSITVDYQIPAGNKSQLDMTGDGDIIGTAWDNSAAPIVRDLLAINAAFIENVGIGLHDVFVTSVMWGHIVVNAEVQSLAGSTNDPVLEFKRDEVKQEFTAVLRGAPWVTFHIVDNGLNLSGTFTKLIADTAGVFTTGIDSRVVQFWECPEPVMNPVTQAESNEYGEYYYHKLLDDPVSYEFHSRYNGLPVLLIPAAICYATLDF